MHLIPILILSLNLFTAFYLITKSPFKKFNFIFSLLLTTGAVHNLEHVLWLNELNISFFLLNTGAFPLTFGPFLYIYFLLITKKQNEIPYIIHFLPFIIIVIFEAYMIYVKGWEKDFDSPPGRPDFPLPGFIYLISIFISILIYSFMIIKAFFIHKKYTEGYFSNISIWKDLKWVVWIVILNFIFHLIIILSPILVREYFHGLRGVLPFFALFFNVSICYFGLQQSNYSHINNDIGKVDVEPEKQKYKNSGLKKDEFTQTLEKLKNFMEKEKPYLEFEFTIDSLSKDIKIPKYQLSQVISEGLNTNFYNYVNEYRIKDVEEEIKKNISEKINYLNLAFSKGFNSKSTFNRAFKNITGMTPSEYQKHIQANGNIDNKSFT